MTQPDPVADRVARLYAPVFDAETWMAGLYLLLTFPAGIFWFTVTVTLVSMGFGMLVIWVGVPILVSLLYVWRGGAALHRGLALSLAGVGIPRPYRPLPDGGLVQRALAMTRDPATWRDGGFLNLLFPLGIVWFVLLVTMWSVASSFLVAPFLVWVTEGQVFDFGVFALDSVPEAFVLAVVGFFLIPLAARLTQAAGRLHADLATALLGPTRTRELEGAVRTATVQRQKSLDTAESERRRIERDLHDGAQQRIVALAMDLGRAKEQFDHDPETARDILDDAHGQAKLALQELRDLARGIHPAVLTDRGLDPALSALAARSPIPVQVDYRLDGRQPINVESAAYFVVSESLANIGKHALASVAAVTVEEEDGAVIVEVMDDGVGGAVPTGNGLSGLADRVEALGGSLSVLSPRGGPTLIRARIPCESS